MESLQEATKAEQPDRAELALIDDLKRGLTPFFDQLAGLAASAQKVFISNVFTPEIRAKIQEVRSELERAIGTFGEAAKEVQRNSSEDTLSRAAGREYHNFFREQINDHRMAFVRLAKLYTALKTFQLETDENLHRIMQLVKKAEVPPESEFYKQLLDFRIAPAQRVIESLRVFCLRISVLLGMNEEPSSVKNFADHCRYGPDINYGFSTLFTPDLRKYVNDLLPVPETPDLPDVPKARRAPTVTKGPEIPHVLDAGGDMQWNRGTHYYFTYDPEKVEQERKMFAGVVYIDTHMGADANLLKGSVIRNFARKEQILEPNDVEQSYTEFLFTYFDLVVEISMLNVSVPHDLRKVFLFHIGPLSFFHLTRRFLQEAGTGTLHLRSGKSMIKKFIPFELLRKTVLDWWRTQVLPAVGPEKNDGTAFNKISKAVRKSHAELRAAADRKYEALPAAEKAGRIRSEVYREHLNEWFGATNIIVFRRFLKSEAD